MLALRFLTGGTLDVASGLFYGADGRPKFYRASDNVQSQAFCGLLPEDLIEILTLHRLDFNHHTSTGVLFHMFGAVSQFGKFGVIAIGNSRDEADQLFNSSLAVLDGETEGEKMFENMITREDAISRLRGKLLELTGNGKSACQVATERGILCGGFARYSDEELREAYRDLVRRNPSISRPALERAANEWQLERQVDVGTLLSCDTQHMFYETCRGWTDFNNAQLARFCVELLGEQVVVTGDRTLPVI